MASFSWPTLSGGGVTVYTNLAAFPGTSFTGDLGVAADTGIVYEWRGASWVAIASPGGSVFSIGTFDSGTPSANGAHIDSNALIMQSASGSNPGLVNTTGQTFAGNKNFSGTIGAFNLSGTNSGDVTLGTASGLSLIGQALSLGLASSGVTGALSGTDWNTFNGKQSALTIGNLADSGTDGISVTGGTGAIIGSGASLSQHVADSTHNGYLSSTDWSTFNGKQASGNYITALTGDITASGPGSSAATLATVNSNVGSFTNANITVNAKGLITAAANGSSAGTVTSVTFTGDGTVLSSTPSSAVTTTGTLTASIKNQNANTFLAGPTSGGAAAPTFRSFSTSDFAAPTFQIFSSGSGTYTLPSSPRSPLYIHVRIVGGGGGGQGSGTSGSGNGGTGGNTTFGTSLLTSNGGVGGGVGSVGGIGGTASVSAPAVGIALQGGSGAGGGNTLAAQQVSGGMGGVSPFGGAGQGVQSSFSGGSAITNSGSGGGGGLAPVSGTFGAGGGAAGYVDAFISSPSSTYSYAVGAAGSAGTLGIGGGAGGAGGSGLIVVEEYYQ